jgi:Tol biopolymer transport system component
MALTSSAILAQDKLPAEQAGEIGDPVGKIAFIREGDVWVMNVDGSVQQEMVQATNADGRLCWSPDDQHVMFTRSGMVDVKGPDLLGGRHKVYDLFVGSMDSLYANNRLFWFRVTTDMGSRGPEYHPDGSRVIFWKDMYANDVNAVQPNYQICTMAPDGAYPKVLRENWQGDGETFLVSPTWNADGTIAAVLFFQNRPQGIVVLEEGDLKAPLDSLKDEAMANHNFVAPAWSPDGKWLACVSNDMNNQGVYIQAPDSEKRYLVFSPPMGAYLNTVAPSFSPDSKWLTFSTTDGSIWIANIAGGGARRLSGPGNDRYPAWSSTKDMMD